MKMSNTPEFHRSYLKFTALVIGSFGPIFFLGTMLSTSEPARWTLDFLSWPIDGVQTYGEPTTRFLSALTGGFLFGWGVTIWCLQKWVYPLAPEGVRKSALFGVIAWFLLDSLGSYFSGTISNVFFNVVVLLLAVGPLWWPAQASVSK
ncbi:hypothetical protein [Algoriphagus litoralis]|uniref:hypothetical protein n=1 Tax=Algoriphagus litoralis TaxID=2202829 RepID=UPI0018E526C5|nr:hypothetical protein [Algoriphagus litoralis]